MIEVSGSGHFRLSLRLGSVCFGLFEFEMMMDYALRRLFNFFVLYFIFQFFRRSAPA